MKQILLLATAFIFGIFIGTALQTEAARSFNAQAPSDGGFEFSSDDSIARLLGISSPPERAGPGDRISEDQILVSNERVLINIQGADWATFTDTNSMDPVIDAGANAIEVAPRSPEDVQVGDIVAYESKYAEGTIIHRVVAKGEDEQGVYYTIKGDNNSAPDPGKVRFEQIKRVVVAIIY